MFFLFHWNFSDEKEKKMKKKSLSIDSNQSNESKGHISPVESSGCVLQTPVIKLEKNSVDVLKSSINQTSSNGTTQDNENVNVNKNYTSSSMDGSASVTLPEGLPPSLILSIQKLIEAARKAGGDGKCKFFNTDVNRILLQYVSKFYS